MILPDHMILTRKPISPMIREKRETVLGGIKTSYGLSPASYDLRLRSLKRPEGQLGGSLRVGKDRWFVPKTGENINGVVMEKFHMPNDLAGELMQKSSWARRGLHVLVTWIDPGFNGGLTIEMTNHSGHDIILHKGMGICQVVFHMLAAACHRPYDGKYSGQSATQPTDAR